MKLVREHINEKFTEDSDPVHDLGIGMIKIIEDFVKTVKGLWGYKYTRGQYLWVCAMEGKMDYVKYLIENGWDIHFQNDLALCWSARNGHFEIVKLLLNTGADVHADNDYALRWAVTSELKEKKRQYEKIVKLLLNAGANVHVKEEDPLRTAVENKHLQMVKILLDNGADIKKVSYVIQWATYDGNKNMVKLLKERLHKKSVK